MNKSSSPVCERCGQTYARKENDHKSRFCKPGCRQAYFYWKYKDENEGKTYKASRSKSERQYKKGKKSNRRRRKRGKRKK